MFAARVLHLLFLACLPAAIILALGGLWIPALIVFLIGVPVFWTLRNRTALSATGRIRAGQSRKSRPGEPLVIPSLELETSAITLPNLLALADPKRSAEWQEVLDVLQRRVLSGEFNEDAERFIRGLMSAITDSEASLEWTVRRLGRSAEVGLAAAAEERARGWQQDGQVDACVSSVFDMAMTTGAFREDTHEKYGLVMFAGRAAYYYARTGPDGLTRLREDLARSRIRLAE